MVVEPVDDLRLALIECALETTAGMAGIEAGACPGDTAEDFRCGAGSGEGDDPAWLTEAVGRIGASAYLDRLKMVG